MISEKSFALELRKRGKLGETRLEKRESNKTTPTQPTQSTQSTKDDIFDKKIMVTANDEEIIQHPKVKIFNTRCEGCYEKSNCPQTDIFKLVCFIDYKIDRIGKFNANANVGGVLTTFRNNSSKFEIIDIGGQKINTYDYVRLFINRDDRYSKQSIPDLDDPTKDNFPDKKNETLTYDILKKSLEGKITIGTRPVNPDDNTIKWICWDIDIDHIDKPKIVADILVKCLKEWYGLTGYIEESGSINSFHVWIFLKLTDNNVAYEFDQEFRKRIQEKLTSMGISLTDPKAIDRGVQLNEGGMIKLPFNIQNKEKRDHRFGRSRFIDGIELSKIQPEELPEPWGSPERKEQAKQQSEQTHTEPHPQNQSKHVSEEYLLQSPQDNLNEEITTTLFCEKCKAKYEHVRTRELTIERIGNAHEGCGGKIRLIPYRTSIEILNGTADFDDITRICENTMTSPNRKQNFVYEIIGNKLVLITATQKEGQSLAGWFRNKSNVEGKLGKFITEPMLIQDTLNMGMSEE